MGHRRRAREYALQMLFQIDLTGNPPADVFPGFWRDQKVDGEVRAFSERLVLGVASRLTELDRLIAEETRNWRVSRMAVVDRNVLRMAAYELLHASDTPPAVIIDEAVEVAKKFGGAESSGFVNGVLDSIRRRGADGDRGGPPS